MKERENFKVIESMQVENIYEVFKTNSNRCYVLKTVWKPHSSTEEITEEQFKEYYNKINSDIETIILVHTILLIVGLIGLIFNAYYHFKD